MNKRVVLIGLGSLLVGLLLTGCFLFQLPPDVDFEASADKGPEPLVVSFTPVLAETPADYEWDFGDGTTSAEPAPIHVYRNAGTYTVSLSVHWPDGRSATQTKVDLVTVDRVPRKAPTPTVYWINRSGVLSWGDRHGVEATVVAERFFSIVGMGIAEQMLYWLDYSMREIARADLDGTNVQSLVYGRKTYYLPWDMALDPAAGKVYWITIPHDQPVDDDGHEWVWRGGIFRANLDGTEAETLVTYPAGADEYATHIAIDPVLGVVFWSLQGDSSWTLKWAYTDYWSPRALYENGGVARALALDPLPVFGATHLYCAVGNRVERHRLADRTVTEILTSLNEPRDIAVDAIEGRLYVATGGGIVRATLEGAEQETLFPGEDVEVLTLD
jgi:PKD repeat protein